MTRHIFRLGMVLALWLGLALPGLAAAADARQTTRAWQERRLFEPSEGQLAQEQRGQVFIYDGLDSGKVQQAMDEQFDRIENMMFTRIHHLPPTATGPVMVEDDGCE
jgi:hypothetical protein